MLSSSSCSISFGTQRCQANMKQLAFSSCSISSRAQRYQANTEHLAFLLVQFPFIYKGIRQTPCSSSCSISFRTPQRYQANTMLFFLFNFLWEIYNIKQICVPLLVAVEEQLLWWIKSQQQLKSSVHSFQSSMFSLVLTDIWWLAADTEIFLHGNPIFKHLHLRYASPSCITFLLKRNYWL